LFCLKKEDLWTASGQPRTRSLFVETCIEGDKPVLSLRGNVAGYPCLRDVYVPLVAEDPSEVSFVEAVFDGDTRWWLRMKKAKWMQEFLVEWNELADIKRKQLAFEAIVREVRENGRSAFTAAKYLIEEPWKGNTKEVKETKQKTTNEAANYFKEDFIRLKDEGLLQ